MKRASPELMVAKQDGKDVLGEHLTADLSMYIFDPPLNCPINARCRNNAVITDGINNYDFKVYSVCDNDTFDYMHWVPRIDFYKRKRRNGNETSYFQWFDVNDDPEITIIKADFPPM
jgi:hypothetical protein